LSWVFLIAAILSEVAGTLALNDGLALGVAYGIWAAAGVALTAALSKPLFGEPLTPMMMGGIGLIILGVLAIELGAGH
jgi:small multidrug resistance pump